VFFPCKGAVKLHIAVAIVSIAACIRWADWRNWSKYHSTMIFAALMDSLYLFLTDDNFLWRYVPDNMFRSYVGTELLYLIIFLPSLALLFLSHYPVEKMKIVSYYLFWVGLLVLLEWILSAANCFEYKNGWNLLWSVGFDMVMFPMLFLHSRKPLLAYVFSLIIILTLLWYFKIPLP
jgi:hypothetical protein